MLIRVLVGLAALLWVAGCSSAVDLALAEPLDIDGLYRSTASVGELGPLELIVAKRVRAVRVFEAELSGPELEASPSRGVGSLGNEHLVLNFDIGDPDDFYFEGFVIQAGGSAVTGLRGTFIFPGGGGQLAVEFERIGDVPVEEAGEAQ